MDYMKQILANNSLDLQLLSLIDILMKIEQRNYGFHAWPNTTIWVI